MITSEVTAVHNGPTIIIFAADVDAARREALKISADLRKRGIKARAARVGRSGTTYYVEKQ